MAPEQLESLPPAADLFDARVTDEDGVPLWLPYNQGDVFEGVPLPSLNGAETAGLVMLFLHPCTMRRGATMAPRLTVLDVRQVSGKRPLDEPRHWDRKYAVIPLPDFAGGGHDAYEADLMEMATVPLAALDRTRRVAVLSELGRSHMLHRVIYHLTRKAVPTMVIERATARVQAELQLQADWTASAWGGADSPLSVQQVEQVEAAFQRHLDVTWPEGAQDAQDTIRARLHSENDKDHEEAFKFVAQLAQGELPMQAVAITAAEPPHPMPTPQT
jgi:hypothetical protein